MKRTSVCLLVIVMIFVGCQSVPVSSDNISSKDVVSEVTSSEVSSEDTSIEFSSEDISSESESSEDSSSVEVEYEGPVADGYKGFITVDGKKLVDENGKEYYIKGMAFGNCVFRNPSDASLTHHTKESYKVLSEMGFNNVRFYLNYGLFEDDSAPYEYKQAGWDWLDKNIKWAKEYGVRLVLNMHYPQGGYQSQGNGHALWTNEENMKRLSALWTEIAKRYSDEPTIMGFGLINEPFVSVEVPADAMDVYTMAVQGMVDSIREVSKNQIVFVERIHTVQKTDTLEKSWPSLNDRKNFPVIDGNNIVYEFHFYNPLKFTHQRYQETPIAYPYQQTKYSKYDINDMKLELKEYLNFSNDNNVPVYCGEFGTSTDGFKEGGGGAQWVSDILDVLMEYGIHLNYHAFHEEMFGLYMNTSYEYPSNMNMQLHDVFVEKFTK